MTTGKNTPTPTLGRVRMSDDSMKGAGIRKGDLALIDLGAKPVDGQPCAAFTPLGKLVVRRFGKLPKGEVLLTRDPVGDVMQQFARGAVIIFGPVVRVEKGGAR
jgi:phage repressor protein C with HTH and peptisase S24 domain